MPETYTKVMPLVVSKSLRKRLEKQGAEVPLTFGEQAAAFLQQEKEERNPLRAETLKTYENRLRNDILPHIANRPMELVDNVQVKSLVGEWVKNNVASSTIRLNISIIKKIRKSAVNDRGEQRFPIAWNASYWRLPKLTVKKATVDAQTVQDAISRLPRHESALAALLAGTGLRIQEAMAVKWTGKENESYWVLNESKLIVCSQFDGKTFSDTKTAAGCREVDLDPNLNEYLKTRAALPLSATPSSAADDRLFRYSESTYNRAFIKAGIKGGFHTLRRFRITYLANQSVPPGLARYWTGHAAGDVHEGYEQFGKEIELRKSEVKRVGLGFELPKEVK